MHRKRDGKQERKQPPVDQPLRRKEGLGKKEACTVTVGRDVVEGGVGDGGALYMFGADAALPSTHPASMGIALDICSVLAIHLITNRSPG